MALLLTRRTRGYQSARALLTTAAAALALCALARPAAAQTEPAPAPGPAPAPPPAAASEELPPPPPPPSYGGSECTPACRSGFICQQGQCISACNPPCAAGEQCSAQGECVTSSSGSGDSYAPSFPEGEELQPPPPPDGVEQHDGFMLRLTLGFGGGAASLEPQDTSAVLSTDISGAGGAFSIDIGGAPVDDLNIHLRISTFTMVDPTVTVDAAGISDELNGSFGSSFFGLGLTYYFMPINLYITAALGVSRLTVDIDSDNEDPRGTDAGFGFNFDVGKEWWVSDNWGLGLAGRFVLVSGTTNDADLETAFGMTAFALLFSATYQ